MIQRPRTHYPASRFIRSGLLLGCALAGPLVQAGPPGAGWAMAWADEFNGTAVDGSHWTIGTGARRDATNTASAVSVGGGALTVKTYTEGGKHYTGWLASNGKFEDCFGYWEARIRFNSSAGMWSAFWLQPYGINNVGDPAGNGTEIDIVEHRRQDSGGADLRNKSAMNIHWDGYGTDHKSVGSTVNNPGVDATSLQGNYHTYGVLWEADQYTLYLDGAAVWSTTAAVSNVRQWIYLTSEVDNGAWAGNIPTAGYGDRTATTTKFEVDYVRFYQRAEQVINPGFTNRTGPWVGNGAASWTATGGRNAGPGVRLNPSTATDSSFEQTVHGLLPNTDYRLFGWGDVGSRTWPDIRFGVKDHGNPEVRASIWSNGFTQAQVPFTTGAANTAARVYAWVPTQWGDCFADDVEIRRDAQINNAGFDYGETWPWYVYGDALVHNWTTYQRSGGYALRLNASANSRGAEQTIYGLQPATAYRLTCWVRTASQPLRLGVKNHGLAEAYTTFTGTGNTWQRATHTFTTGPTATSATIYAYIPAGSNVSAMDLDDFMLGTALPAPWTATDVGAVGRTGETTVRDGRLVLRGSGANVFDAADAFHFVQQPLTGDCALTARLDSFEADQARAKAGIMLRAATTATAAHAMVHWLPEGQVEFIWRPTDGVTSSYVWAATSTPWPPHLRLLRIGSVVTAFYSTDGDTWLQVGTPQVIALPAAVRGGLAVCAHDAANTASAVFSNIIISGDRDDDGILDLYETHTGSYLSATDTGTDPDNPDSDGDGFSDGAELTNGTNPMVANTELVWQVGAAPGGTGTWDATITNWRVGTTATPWLAGKAAMFGGTAGTVTVAGTAASAAAMTFSTSGYTLAGTGSLALVDGAVLTTITGTTTIACPLRTVVALTKAGAGTLTLTAPSLPVGTLTCAAGTLDLSPTAAATFAGILTGPGKLTKSGSNTLRLTGTSTHSQLTTVNGGTLRLDGTFTTATVQVAAAGTLAGTGTLPAATIAGTLAHALDEAPLTVTGALTLTNATLALIGSATAPVHLLVNRGTLSGAFAHVTVPIGYTLDPAYLGTAVALVRKPTADFEIWAAGHGLAPLGNGAPALDPDADGLANAIEFVLDLDPTSADLTSPNLPHAALSGADLLITITRVKAAATNGFFSAIEWTTDLTAPTWTTATAAQTHILDHGTTETVTVTLPPPPVGSSLFARLRVTGP